MRDSSGLWRERVIISARQIGFDSLTTRANGISLEKELKHDREASKHSDYPCEDAGSFIYATDKIAKPTGDANSEDTAAQHFERTGTRRKNASWIHESDLLLISFPHDFT